MSSPDHSIRPISRILSKSGYFNMFYDMFYDMYYYDVLEWSEEPGESR